MEFRDVGSAHLEIFLRYSAQAPLSGCVGTTEGTEEPVRVIFAENHRSNLLIVGRSPSVALGICTMLLLDLAAQMISTPDWQKRYASPPFSILDYLGEVESRIFTDAAMSLPLATKLERATDTAMTTVNDLHNELVKRRRELQAPRQAKFMFLCGLQAAHGIRSLGSYATATDRRAAAFIEVLRNGPSRSLHAVVWCNSLANIDLTMADGLDHFDHIVLLGDVEDRPAGLSIPAGPGRSWYVDRAAGEVTPITPFSVPTDEWCDAAVRGVSDSSRP